MSFYLVRTISKKKLVGLFFAEAIPHLVVIISKFADTEDCECIELPDGGIVWKGNAPEIPLETNGRPSWEGAEFTEKWEKAFHVTGVEWVKLLSTADVTE